jgi:hypothetical protein
MRLQYELMRERWATLYLVTVRSEAGAMFGGFSVPAHIYRGDRAQAARLVRAGRARIKAAARAKFAAQGVQ